MTSATRRRRWLSWLACLCLVGLSFALWPRLGARSAFAQGAKARGVVLVMPIEGMVDLGMGPFVERALDEAQAQGALGLILDVNTLGGRVDAAIAIRDQLVQSAVQSVAFINPRAISAGALIALSAQRIAIAQGATIGAATPVMMGAPGEGTQPTDEKTVSYVRKEFRATADARGRPGLIAEAMVDPEVEIEGLIAKGKLLTLTTDEALEHGLADYFAADLDAVLQEQGWVGAELRQLEMNWAERVVRYLTHPVVASLLMTLGVLGLVVELRTPGFGVPGIVGFLCLCAFFWGHALVQLVGLEQVLLLLAGVLLLAAEIFLIPGFGLAGVLGIAAILYALTSSLIGDGANSSAVLGALARVAISAVLALGASLLVLPFLPKLPGGQRLVLGAALPSGAGDAPPTAPGSGALVSGSGALVSGSGALVGVRGKALSPLRPAGIAELEGQRVDVVSQGEFIDAGVLLEVVRDEGARVVVKRAEPLASKGDQA